MTRLSLDNAEPVPDEVRPRGRGRGEIDGIQGLPTSQVLISTRRGHLAMAPAGSSPGSNDRADRRWSGSLIISVPDGVSPDGAAPRSARRSRGRLWESRVRRFVLKPRPCRSAVCTTLALHGYVASMRHIRSGCRPPRMAPELVGVIQAMSSRAQLSPLRPWPVCDHLAYRVLRILAYQRTIPVPSICPRRPGAKQRLR